MYNNNENNTADRLLVERVLDGDKAAFASVIKNTEGLVAQIVYKMIANSEDRKDIAQDIYLSTFRQLKGFRFQAKLSTWIGRIAYNTCINYLKKKKLVLIDNESRDDEPTDDILELASRGNGHSDNEVEKRVFRKELSEILKEETDRLSPVYKTLITLYHNEDLSYAEIAEITELPEGTVKNYLFRARKTLKNNLLLTYKKEAL